MRNFHFRLFSNDYFRLYVNFRNESAKAAQRANDIHKSTIGRSRESLLKDKVSGYLYEGGSCYENQLARIESTGNN